MQNRTLEVTTIEPICIPLSQVLEILAAFQAKAASDIQTDRSIKADPYENIGRLKLIAQIKKAIGKACSNPPDDCHTVDSLVTGRLTLD